MSSQVRPQPLIAVSDVEASSRWYQCILGCESGHGGSTYERLEFNGELVMQLHSFQSDHDHGSIGDPSDKPYGNGVLLWFEVSNFDETMARVAAMRAEIVIPIRRNPADGNGGPNQWECWIRDPDGYVVVIASAAGTADGNWRP